MTFADKNLFTPGPVNTSPAVKRAMLRDIGSRDLEFMQLVAEIRQGILSVAGASKGFDAILMQGSGTFAVESVFCTTISPNDRVLILINGAYGRRMAEIADCLAINYDSYEVAENRIHDPKTVHLLLECGRFTHVAAVHCETTTGILNPIMKWGTLAKNKDCQFIVDAISSFGGVAIELEETHIDYLISSANKCLQGVPGFAFVVARRDSLCQICHKAKSVSLDLRKQWEVLEATGQIRFTPPTHAILAFHQALRELEMEGGVIGRSARYQNNHQRLINGMNRLGFQAYLPRELQGSIITAFEYPNSPNFDFGKFYCRLSERGMLIYPAQISAAECFRIGNIGNLFLDDIERLLQAIAAILVEMEVEMVPLLD